MLLADYIKLLSWFNEKLDGISDEFDLPETFASLALNGSLKSLMLNYDLNNHYFYLTRGYKDMKISDEDALRIAKEIFGYEE